MGNSIWVSIAAMYVRKEREEPGAVVVLQYWYGIGDFSSRQIRLVHYSNALLEQRPMLYVALTADTSGQYEVHYSNALLERRPIVYETFKQQTNQVSTLK